MTQPYTYLIGWPEHNKWYYGVRYADNCHPSDLCNPYKTSSKLVQKYISLYGDPSVKQIRRTFSCKNSARAWENRVLKRLNVVNENKWLNKTDNKSIEPLYGDDHPNSKRRGENSPLYKKSRPAHIAEIKRQEWLKNNPMNNRESKEKSILKRSGENHHMKRADAKEKVSGKNNWIYKTPGALEERRKRFIEMNKARKGIKYEKIPCPYCNIDMPKNNFKRHTSLCKQRNID